jgi:hypothetical protein
MSWQNVDDDPLCAFCSAHENIWSFLDAAYVICLEDRNDRFQHALAEVHRTGLCQITTFFRAKRHKDGFISGCWDSHVQLAQRGLHHVHNTILSLEDDFQLDIKRAPRDIASQISNALHRLPADKWTRLSLGHISWFKMYYAPGVNRSSSILTHAQIWSKKGMEWMIANPIDYRYKSMLIHIDGFISLNLRFSYSITPMVAFQNDLKSDRDPNGDVMLTPEMMASSETWIPIVWTICVVVVIVLLLLVLLHFKTSWMLICVIILCVFLVPLALVWTLFLTDVC